MAKAKTVEQQLALAKEVISDFNETVMNLKREVIAAEQNAKDAAEAFVAVLNLYGKRVPIVEQTDDEFEAVRTAWAFVPPEVA